MDPNPTAQWWLLAPRWTEGPVPPLLARPRLFQFHVYIFLAASHRLPFPLRFLLLQMSDPITRPFAYYFCSKNRAFYRWHLAHQTELDKTPCSDSVLILFIAFLLLSWLPVCCVGLLGSFPFIYLPDLFVYLLWLSACYRPHACQTTGLGPLLSHLLCLWHAHFPESHFNTHCTDSPEGKKYNLIARVYFQVLYVRIHFQQSHKYIYKLPKLHQQCFLLLSLDSNSMTVVVYNYAFTTTH